MKMNVALLPVFVFLLPAMFLPFSPGPAAWGAERQWRDVPGTIVINEVPPVPRSIAWQDRFGPVTFDHGMHTALTKCGTCHHTHRNIAYGLCDNCHTQVPGLFAASATHMFMGCKYCHGQYSPSKPWMPGLKTALHQTCFGCHVGIGELGVSPAGCARTCHTGNNHTGIKTEKTKTGAGKKTAPPKS
ncbi:MAG: cytochrome c3 family protein [Nitrospiraceae bacterium]|nr:cytochrome c3 family protein [Nitrospiraceae bacterium]